MANSKSLQNTFRLSSLLAAFVTFVVIPMSAGCSTFNLRGSAVQELEDDNERLLTEYRNERQRRENAEKSLRDLEAKLAASEKLVAQRYSPLATRTPSNNAYPTTPPLQSDLNGLGNHYRGPIGGNTGDSLQWQRRNGR